MKMKCGKAMRKALAGAVLGSTILLSPNASGAMALIYDLDHRFSGATLPGENAPWAVATFLQLDVNTVGLHLKANDIGPGYLANWWFNFEGNLSTISILGISGTQGVSQPVFSYATQNTALFNSGRDSILWDFSFYSGGSSDFQSGDQLSVTLYSASGLDVHQFDSSVGAGGGPNLYSGANINGLPGTEKIAALAPRWGNIQESSPQFTLVPEASTTFLGFLLLAGCVGGEILRRHRESAAVPAPVSVS